MTLSVVKAVTEAAEGNGKFKMSPKIKPTRPRKKESGLCVHCRHAKPLERKNPHNPIVIECEVNGERQVARIHHCRIDAYDERADAKMD